MNIFVFDFDCTLTANHFWKIIHNNWLSDHKVDWSKWDNESKKIVQRRNLTHISKANSLLQYIWASNYDGSIINMSRYDQLMKWLQKLYNKTDLAISSNGQAQEVLTMLKVMKCEKIFKYIHGYNNDRTNRIVIDNTGKVIYIDEFDKTKLHFLKYLYRTKYGRIIYIDDSNNEQSEVDKHKYIDSYYLGKEIEWGLDPDKLKQIYNKYFNIF